MHSAGIASIPPHNAADINIASTSFRLNGGVDLQLSPTLGWGEEMQHAVKDHRFFASKISFRLTGSRIFCASRMRVRFHTLHNKTIKRDNADRVFSVFAYVPKLTLFEIKYH
jgi:hypothetical protein